MICMEMRRVTQDLMEVILGIKMDIHTSQVVALEAVTLPLTPVDGRQWVVKETRRLFPSPLVVTVVLVEVHLVLTLVIYFPTFLVVG